MRNLPVSQLSAEFAFVEGAASLLLRPDGVVARRGDGDAESALRQWFLHSIE
jgi:hypothetical protein